MLREGRGRREASLAVVGDRVASATEDVTITF
jgi:hypothetical protein